MRGLRRGGLALGLAALVALTAGAGPGFADAADCRVQDREAKEVLPGVTLRWDSAFRCTDAPGSGTYAITVSVSNDAASDEAVELGGLRLSHATPRPRGQGPDASARASGVPLAIEPGGSASFRVSGDYELVSTDEGDKANLHLRAAGEGAQSGEPFRLGVNVHLRGDGATENRSGERAGGPPPWAGPPAWARGAASR